MRLLPDIGYPQTGDIASCGTYACLSCPHDVEDDKSLIVLNKKGKLPTCPVCKNTVYWLKL